MEISEEEATKTLVTLIAASVLNFNLAINNTKLQKWNMHFQKSQVTSCKGFTTSLRKASQSTVQLNIRLSHNIFNVNTCHISQMTIEREPKAKD